MIINGMDVTLNFKTCVKAITLCDKEDYKARNETIKLINMNQSEFYVKTQKLSFQIKKLYTLLMETSQAYLNLCNYLGNKWHINDINQDEIDVIAVHIISICKQLLSELKKDIAVLNVSQQHGEHKNAIISLIEEYLNQVSSMHSEQKVIREENVIEHKKLSKLHLAMSKKIPIINDVMKFTITERNDNESNSLKVQEINGDMNVVSCNQEDLLSPEDIQIFESENEQLYNELTTLAEEVKQIETKVVHITELQEYFTHRILEQNKSLDEVFTTVIGSTENVKEANEHIRKAIQRNAGLRVWILFFLLVMSFTLIFLDWYNP